MDLDRLLMAMNRQKIEIPVERKTILLLYENEIQKEAIAMAGQYRKDGIPVTLVRRNPDFSMEGYRKYARRNGLQRCIT